MLLLAFRVFVCAACCVLFRVFIHRGLCLQRFQDGLFRLRKAQNACLLSLQEKLHGNRSLFNRIGILNLTPL